MTASSTITAVGVTLIIIAAITKILDFYGVGPDVYGTYIGFYTFLIIASFVLPRYYYVPKIKDPPAHQ